MKILVDADACPVKEEIVSIGDSHGLETVFVASYNHMTSNDLGKKWVYVDTDKESADLYIVNRVKSGDVVISQDIGLAGLLLKKNVIVLTPRGKHYTEYNIETALQFRYLSAKGRREGIHSKGPKPFLEEDRKNFKDALEKILSNIAGINR
ncbi:YaiI/YqxD family protein [Bacillus sp. FJAT-42376]|uniref:YaiI/YqxD family protein n=1 Tax=Bacillus sp. FJAT-42376 TaxID=2014076 RepID=UPI001F151E67|nr:YaiI/YqxD family protein [Bacillus sp. FJAT-42376]